MSESKPSLFWGSVVVGILALGFMGLGAAGVHEKQELEKNGRDIEAKVTDTRIMRGKSGTTHELQYSFQLEGEGKTYTRCDFLGRSNLWSTLPEDEWETVRRAGKIRVRYVPGDPGNNAPAAHPPKWSDIWTAFGIGMVLLFILIVSTFAPRKHGEL